MSTAGEFLSEGGPIAKRLPAYEARPQQIEMAAAVEAAFAAGEPLVIEAGTGVGKTFAYLVPAIQRVLEHGGRVVVSTHTIALQEQLMEKDIPLLKSVFPRDFSAVLVKGRSNYLGLRRLARASARSAQLFDGTGEIGELHAIEDWAYQTDDGTLSDLPRHPSLPVWERVKSDSDDCLGRKCPHFKACFYQRARRRAVEAQLLIVNHALLFSDLALRQEGASVLPDYEYLVLDEAHTLENVAGDHLGLSLSNAQVSHLLSSLRNERTGKGLLSPRAPSIVFESLHAARAAHDEYFGGLAEWSAEKGRWNGRLREPPPVDEGLSARLMDVRDRLREVREDIEDDNERLEYASLMERCDTLATAVQTWHSQKSEGWVHWLDVGGRRMERMTLGARPIDIGPLIRTLLFDKLKSVVLTSATLTTAGNDPFSYLRSRLSLDGFSTRALGSPFDYPNQLEVFIEADMPDPTDTARFLPAACEAIQKYTLRSQGRAFVLFTSFDLLRRCAGRLAPFFEAQNMPLFVHGAGESRSKLLTQFKTTRRSVLFGTDSFWAGVDVPGEALSNVIITKLPFSVPDQPVAEARIEAIRQRGGNPFMEYQVPEAVLKFRQGVGRLIRTRTDRGLLVILDPRVISKPYGRRFLDSLPDCRVTEVTE